MSVRLTDSLATTESLAEVFSDRSVLAALLRVEAALARVEARLGAIPAAAADAIARAAAAPEQFDTAELARAARTSGTIVVPFVGALKARIAETDQASATFVHWGTTSQDVSDTALALLLGQARDLIAHDHRRLAAALRRLSEDHSGTVMLARTLLQPAGPTTFGLKAAGWHGEVARTFAHLEATFEQARVLQFGGAAGTLAALGRDGLRIAEGLASELGLRVPDAPWHAHRGRLAALVAACGVFTASLGKIARDVALLMQHEVAEAAEPGGGSSSMPHKRNPGGCAVVLAAATRVPGLVSAFLGGMLQEHERGVGGWHAEWPTITGTVEATASAVAAAAGVFEQLQVYPEQMRANVENTRGTIFAERALTMLAPAIGRQAAARAIDAALDAARRGEQDFASALSTMPEVANAPLRLDAAALSNPETYLGAAEEFRRRLLGDSGVHTDPS
jgi:3-carboxy-cis,cis-muconate cycloisomerase